MHLPELISDLAIILLTGGVVTVLFRKLNQPLVLGYILAGFLIGPYTSFFFTVADAESIHTWSEIGIIILMFGLGLEFNLHKLISVGGTGVITALTEVFGMLLLGFVVGQLMGWGRMDSLFLGGMLSMSSTTIIIKAFDDLKVREEPFAQLVFGTLVIEDIAGIFMMIILSTISVGQSVSGRELGVKLAILVLYLVLWLLSGIYLVPTLLKRASPLMSDETLLITSLGLCFGMVLLADWMGFSSALGAFLAGSLLAGTVHAERVEHLTQSVKDLFGAVFFMSVGMMVEPGMIVRHIVPILILTLVTIVGKLVISSLGVLLSGKDVRTAIHCGCSLAQIGEFAFIIAGLGLSLGVIADYIYPIIIAVSILTTLTTPFFIQHADQVADFIIRLLPKKLREKLTRYEGAAPRSPAQENAWISFLRRYFNALFFNGAIMLGVSLIGQQVLVPLLGRLLGVRISNFVALLIVWALMSLFIRPMLDTKSPEFQLLWTENRAYHLPLSALSALRFLVIVLLYFLTLQRYTGVSSLWLLPIIALAVLLASRMGWLASTYLKVEARFLANLNERQLSRFADINEGRQWLDEQLCVDSFPCEASFSGRSLKELAWGEHFGVNVIRLSRGRRLRNMPSGNVSVMEGDSVTVIGTAENLRRLRHSLGLPENPDVPTLRAFIAAQEDKEHDLYAYALPIEKDSVYAGSTIRASSLRDTYDCMILGLQRENLILVQPDVDTVMQSDDLIWILGTRTMAQKLLLE